MESHILHLSVGPVQGFIAEGRRTRDLWAGSFLLSWLTARAMAKVALSEGKITSPHISDKDKFWLAVKAHVGDEAVPECNEYIARFPNHFRAEVRENFDPNECVQEIQKSWCKIASAVWDAFIKPTFDCLVADENLSSNLKENVSNVWKQQIGNENDETTSFWDVVWVKGEDPKDRSEDLKWLDYRKFTRIPKPAYGGAGRFCSLMTGLVSLTGTLNRDEEGMFWRTLQTVVNRYPSETSSDDINNKTSNEDAFNSLDLGASERLSAVALVKRLFPLLEPKIREGLIGWDPQRTVDDKSQENSPYRPIQNWPSTSHIAASAWLKRAVDKEKDGCETLGGFGKIGAKKKIPRIFAVAEEKSKLECFKDDDTGLSGFDARLFYPDDELHSNLPDEAKKVFSDLVKTEFETKDGLRKKIGTIGLPSSYYAIICADGDKLGQLLRIDHGDLIPKKIDQFTNQVNGLFSEYFGFMVYCAGEDILGLVSVDEAINLAKKIKDIWDDTFKDLIVDRGGDGNPKSLSELTKPEPGQINEDAPTISIAITFVHAKHALRWGLESAQNLLGEIAKEKMGRDSLALQILRLGKNDSVWAAPWKDQKRFEALQRLIDNEVCTNGFTYSIGRKLPWLLAPQGVLPFNKFNQSKQKIDLVDFVSLSDTQIEGLLLGCGLHKVNLASDFYKVASLDYKLGGEERPLLSPDIIAILRFLLEHRRPMYGTKSQDGTANEPEAANVSE